jgi:hypothetical protein
MLRAHPPRRPLPCNRTATFAPAHTQHHEIMFDPGITSLERKDHEWENLAVAELHALRMEVAPKVFLSVEKNIGTHREMRNFGNFGNFGSNLNKFKKN